MRLATGALSVFAAGIALAPASGFGAPRTLVTTGAGVASARLAALSPSGIGPIRFGMTLAEGTAAADLPVTSVPGINGCSEWRIQGLGTGLELVAFGGRLEYALAYSSAIATTRGVRVGDSVARLRRQYRGMLRQGRSGSLGGQQERVFSDERIGTRTFTLEFSLAAHRVSSIAAGSRHTIETFGECA